MGGAFKHLFWIAPVTAILLYFSLQGQEEIKVEQKADKIDQQIQEKEFDADFAAAWNGGGKKPLPERDNNVAELKKKKAALAKQSESLNVQSTEDMADLRQALESEGGKPHEAK